MSVQPKTVGATYFGTTEIQMDRGKYTVEVFKFEDSASRFDTLKKLGGLAFIVVGAAIVAFAVMVYLNPHSFPVWIQDAVTYLNSIDFLGGHGALVAQIATGLLGVGILGGGSYMIDSVRTRKEDPDIHLMITPPKDLL